MWTALTLALLAGTPYPELGQPLAPVEGPMPEPALAPPTAATTSDRPELCALGGLMGAGLGAWTGAFLGGGDPLFRRDVSATSLVLGGLTGGALGLLIGQAARQRAEGGRLLLVLETVAFGLMFGAQVLFTAVAP